MHITMAPGRAATMTDDTDIMMGMGTMEIMSMATSDATIVDPGDAGLEDATKATWGRHWRPMIPSVMTFAAETDAPRTCRVEMS
jgi:hypothetical protein